MATVNCVVELVIRGYLMPRELEPDSVHLTETGEGVPGWECVSGPAVIEAIDAAEERGVRVLLLVVDCKGGSAGAGLQVYERLRRFSRDGGKVVTFTGLAASVASVVAVAGDFNVMHPRGQFVLHGAKMASGGSAARLNRQLVDLLAARTRQSRKTLKWAHMSSATWTTVDANEAIRGGWADAIGSLKEARALALAVAEGRPVSTPRSRALLVRTEKSLPALAAWPAALAMITEPTFGLVGQMVRIQTITETMINGAPVYEIEAVEWPVGFCQAPAHLTGSNESMNYLPPGGADVATGTVGGLVAAALSTWIVGSIPYNSSGWRSVVEMTSGYPGRIVAVGYATHAAYSITQGRTWTAGTIPAGDYESVCFGGSAGLLAVGNNGVAAAAATSSDGGATWTSRAIGGNDYMRAVGWNGSRYVAVGLSGAGRWSTDGTTWNTVTMPTVNGHNGYAALAWSPTAALWLAVGNYGVSATSPDGNTWTGRGIDTASSPVLTGVAWSAPLGLFSIVGLGGLAYTSRDGVAWHKTSIPSASDSLAVAWGGGVFVAPAGNGPALSSVAYSYDGINWNTRDTDIAADFMGIAYLQGGTSSTSRFIGVGFTYGVSTDPECAISGMLP